MLEDVGEGKEPPFSRHDLSDFLHLGRILLDAVEFFDTAVVILSRFRVKNTIGGKKSLCEGVREATLVGNRSKYLVMRLYFEIFVVSTMAKSQRVVLDVL